MFERTTGNVRNEEDKKNPKYPIFVLGFTLQGYFRFQINFFSTWKINQSCYATSETIEKLKTNGSWESGGDYITDGYKSGTCTDGGDLLTD